MIAIYDNKRCGEAMTAPHLRVPPFRKEHAQKVVRAFIQCRGSAELHDGDLMFFFDAGRHGALSVFLHQHTLDHQHGLKCLFSHLT